MKPVRVYCPRRRELEDSTWIRTEEMNQAFWRTNACRSSANGDGLLAACSELVEARAELSEARYRLTAHRTEHGC